MDYKIAVDLSGVAAQAANQLAGALPLVSQAVAAVANEAAARWKSAVLKAPLWQGEKEAYTSAITWRMEGAFAAVVETGYKNAGPIETGRPAFDQKRYLQTSLKVRRVVSGKNAGKKYLVIPFRHNTPGMDAHATPMPARVYELASQLKKSRVTGQSMQPNLQGKVDAQGLPVLVRRNHYQWGGRLPEGLAPKLKAHHATDPYAGMVRMDTTAKGKKVGSSAYLTFRVMGEWSQGWITPARPGLFLAQGVAKAIEPLAEGAIKEAMRQTVLGAL